MKYLQFLFVVLVSAYALSAPASTVTAHSTATLITDPGPYEGWYLYEVDLTWDIETVEQGSALSNWDFLIQGLCVVKEHSFEFPSPAGYCTSEDQPDNPTAVTWEGVFMRYGDPSSDPEITDPMLKFEPPEGQAEEPYRIGYGTFQFYADVAPVSGTVLNGVLTKAGEENVWGDITGEWPLVHCPEPGTVTLVVLGLGSLALVWRRRK